jgi:hypothetical protein
VSLPGEEIQIRHGLPTWVIALNAATMAFGVIYLVDGQLVAGLIFLGGPPVAFTLGGLLARYRDTGEGQSVVRSLAAWTLTFAGAGSLLLLGGVVAVLTGSAAGVALLVVGTAAMYLAGRILQAKVTVTQLLRLLDDPTTEEQAVLLGREPGARGLLRPGWIVGVGPSRLAIARASFGRSRWEMVPLSSLSTIDIRVTGAGGDLLLANEKLDLHITAISEGQLRAAEAIVGPGN